MLSAFLVLDLQEMTTSGKFRHVTFVVSSLDLWSQFGKTTWLGLEKYIMVWVKNQFSYVMSCVTYVTFKTLQN